METRLPDDPARLRALLPKVLEQIRSQKATLLAEVMALGGRPPATAEFESEGHECEKDAAGLQRLILKALAQWRQERSALEAAIGVAKTKRKA